MCTVFRYSREDSAVRRRQWLRALISTKFARDSGFEARRGLNLMHRAVRHGY